MNTADIEKIANTVQQQETEAKELFQQIEKLRSGNYALSDKDKTKNMCNLEAENAKLAYRVLHLERALEAEMKKQNQGAPVDFSNGMINIIEKLEAVFTKAISKSFPDLQPVPTAQ